MNHHTLVLGLGFPNFFMPTRIGAISNSLRITNLISGKVFTRLRSSSTSNINNSSIIHPQESTMKSRVGEDISATNNADTIGKMTIQQLKSKLRSIGGPTKGSKQDLICAFKQFFAEEVDDPRAVVEDEKSIEVNQADGEKSSKRKAKNRSVEEHAEVTTESVDKMVKRRAKQATDISITVTSKVKTETKNGSGSLIVSEDLETKVDISEHQVEPWTVLAHKKPQKDWIAYNPKVMREPPLSRDIKHVKLMSWNVNGLRALLKLESFSALELAQREDFDVLCLQETKLQEKDVEAIKQRLLEGYDNSFWTCSVSKLGYSGTAIISRIPPLSVKYGLGISDHDSEGRLVTTEFESFYLISGYVPNSGDGLRRLSYRITEWDPSLSNYIKELEKSKPVILTGDLNCAHEEIDIFNPAGNKLNSFVFLSPNSVYHNKESYDNENGHEQVVEEEDVRLTKKKRKIALQCLSDAVRGHSMMLTCIENIPSLEKIVMTDSDKRWRISVSGGKIAEMRNGLSSPAATTDQILLRFSCKVSNCYVPLLELPVSGYVFKGATLFLCERDDLPEGNDDSMTINDMNDYSVDKEEAAYSEAMMEIFKNHSGRMEGQDTCVAYYAI